MQNYKRHNSSRYLRATHLEVGDFLRRSVKKDIDDALQLIKKKLEKTPQVRKSVTESQKNGNNINKKGGGIKHG